MNTRFPGCLVGTTTTTSGTITLDSGALPFGAKLDDFLVDGNTYAFYVRWPDNTTTGFLEGFGVWSATGTGSITRAKIINSTAGEATDYTFAAGTKHILITTPGALFGNLASVFINLEPWEDILIGFTSQSNGTSELALYTGSGPADTTRVKDWSRIAANTGSPAWRDVVKADAYTYTATNPHLGTGRARSGTKTGSIIHSLATQLALMTGRLVRTVSVTRGATSLADPTYGWGYLPSVGTTVSKVFADEVAAAISQMQTDDPRQTSITKLHLYVIAQGENDAAAGESGSPYYGSSSAQFGWLLADHLRALEDTARWGICDENTIHLLYDIPPAMRGIRAYQATGANEFDGHAQAAQIFGSRAIVVPVTEVAMNADGIHYTGEGADEAGLIGANLLLSNTYTHSNTGGAVRLVKNNTYPDPSYIRDSDSDASAPSATIRWRFNVAHTVIKIHKTSNLGDMEVYGLGKFQIGDVLRFEENGVPADYIDVTITSLATDNTTWFQYSCTEVSVGTVAAGATFDIKPKNCAFHDGESYTASVAHNIASTKQNLVNKDTGYSLGATATIGAEIWRNHHVAIINEQGRQYRSRKLGSRYGAIRTTAATANQLILGSYHFEDGRVEYVKATVCYKVPANGNVGIYTIEAVLRRTGSTTALDGETTLTVVINEEALATPPNIIAATFIGVGEGYKVQVTGKSATNIDWVCEVETIEIPTSA